VNFQLKKVIITFFIIITALILIYLPYYKRNISFEETLKKINYENLTIPISKLNIRDFMSEIPDEDMLTAEEDSILFSSPYVIPPTAITRKEAIYDVDIYFKALKSSYAPYNYYGGDEKFLNAKKSILTFIGDNDIIHVDELTQCMKDKLSFIPDNHFYIGKQDFNLENTYRYYSNFSLNIFKNRIGYYVEYGNVYYYIKTINEDNNIEKYFKLSINTEGKLVYKLGLMKKYNGQTSHTINVVFYRGESEYINDIELKLSNTLSEESTSPLEYTNINDIPIISSREIPYNINMDGIDFIKTASEVKNSPASIIDLRGNHGGDILTALNWINEYFGISSQGKGLFLLLYGRSKDTPSYYDFNTFDKDLETLQLEKVDAYYYDHIPKFKEELNKSSSTIFVLTDKETASAAEFFIEHLKDFENIVVVGTNTHGTLESSNVELGYLPHSHIEFSYGNWLRLYDDNFFKEGEGIKPDLWVDGQDALDLTLKLIENYNLK
jgi:hypothetical protein